MTNFEKVGLFMKTFGQEVKNKPGFSSEKINNYKHTLNFKKLIGAKCQILIKWEFL